MLALEPDQQAFLILSTVRSFSQSSSLEICSDNVPKTGKVLGLDQAHSSALINWIVDEATNLWHRMIDPADQIPLGHDGYLKLWALGNPVLDYDYVLLDEAQDTNPVVLEVVQNQTRQIVFVGDRHQQIYAWRGAVNAMEQITTEYEAKLTQSFRFGQAIADAATNILRKLGETDPVRGNPKVQSEILSSSHTDAVLTRTNASVIAETLNLVTEGRLPHIVGGTTELKALVRDVFELKKGIPGSHPDFFGFSTWKDVVEFSEKEEGADLRPFVTLVEQNGPGRLWAAICASSEDETKADVAVSTAHKAKGREWRSVRISDDFSASIDKNSNISEEEARLFYVTITRAKERLSVDSTLLASFTD